MVVIGVVPSSEVMQVVLSHPNPNPNPNPNLNPSTNTYPHSYLHPYPNLLTRTRAGLVLCCVVLFWVCLLCCVVCLVFALSRLVLCCDVLSCLVSSHLYRLVLCSVVSSRLTWFFLILSWSCRKNSGYLRLESCFNRRWYRERQRQLQSTNTRTKTRTKTRTETNTRQ